MKWIDNCTKDDKYQFEIDNMCYESCPIETHNSINIYLCEQNIESNFYYIYNNPKICFDDIPDGFYLKGLMNAI